MPRELLTRGPLVLTIAGQRVRVEKAQPTLSDVHVNAPLTALSVAYLQAQQNFVADQVFPIVPVMKASDRYYKFNRDLLLKNRAKLRAPGTESAGGGVTIDNTPSYAVSTYAFHKDVDDQIRANSDSVLNPDRNAMQIISQAMLITRELDFFTKYGSTGLGWADLTGVAANPGASQYLQWNDDASDPVQDIEGGKSTIALTGFEANTLTLARDVFAKLKNNGAILDRIKFGGSSANPATVNERVLAEVFGLDKVIVARAVYDAGQENATLAPAFIFSKRALLTHSAPAPGLEIPSAGYIFAWTGYPGANAYGAVFRNFRLEWLRSDRFEGEMSYAQALTGGDLGVMFDAAIA